MAPNLSLSVRARHQVDPPLIHDNSRGVDRLCWQRVDVEPVVGPSIVALAHLSRLLPPREAAQGQDEAVSDQSEGRVVPPSLHRLFVVDSQVRIDLQSVLQHCLARGASAGTSNDEDICISRLNRVHLGWQDISTTIPPHLLLHEALESEIKEVDVDGVGFEVVDTVLILVTISHADGGDTCIQVSSPWPVHIGHFACLLDDLVAGGRHIGAFNVGEFAEVHRLVRSKFRLHRHIDIDRRLGDVDRGCCVV